MHYPTRGDSSAENKGSHPMCSLCLNATWVILDRNTLIMLPDEIDSSCPLSRREFTWLVEIIQICRLASRIINKTTRQRDICINLNVSFWCLRPIQLLVAIKWSSLRLLDSFQLKELLKSWNPSPTVAYRPSPEVFRRLEVASHPYLNMLGTRQPPFRVPRQPVEDTERHSPR